MFFPQALQHHTKETVAFVGRLKLGSSDQDSTSFTNEDFGFENLREEATD